MDENGRELKEKDPLRSEILADDASVDHEKRLTRYSVAMARKQEVVDHILVLKEQGYKFNLDKELKALQDCGSFLIYRHYYLVDRFRLLAGCTCKKHLLCPLCAIRRAAKCVAVGFQKIEDVLQRGYETGVEYDQVLITLTIKNGDDLEERFLHLTNSFKMLLQKRRNALKKRPKTDTVFKHVLGCRHLLSHYQNGIEIQTYVAIIVCLLIALWTGRKPTLRTYEMLCFHMTGLASEEELLAQLRPGVDGLILQVDHHRATFLPAVWEKLPDPAMFLSQLKLKAGLPLNFWSPQVRAERYITESFGAAVADL